VYEVLSEARQKLFDWVRLLSHDQYTRAFPFGRRSVRGSLAEIALGEWFLSMWLREERLPPLVEWSITEERLPTFADLERVWSVQSQQTCATLAGTTDWNRTVACRLIRPTQTVLLTATKADVATQLLMHEVHHRAQAMAMLRQLGVQAQNLDYISLTGTSNPVD